MRQQPDGNCEFGDGSRHYDGADQGEPDAAAFDADRNLAFSSMGRAR